MATKHDYLSGSIKAELAPHQVTAPWGSGSHCLTRIGLANTAFEIYHTAINNINAVADVTHRNAMLTKLTDARETGWGRGVSDLEESFEHLANSSGIWSDDNTKTYFGGPQHCIQRSLVSDAPEGPANFLEKVDEGMVDLRRVLGEFGEQAERLNRAQQSSDWATIGTVLGNVKTGAENAKPWLWAAPAVERVAGGVVTFADVAGKIHSGATMFVRSRQAGFSEGEAALLTALQQAVGVVPVLGSFYGKAVEMIPGLVTWYRGLINDRIQRIERASRGY